MSSKKKNKESHLFEEAMSGVKPLRDSNRIDPLPGKVRPVPRQTQRDEKAVISELLELDSHSPLPETGEELKWIQPGVQNRTFQRLRRGHYSVMDVLDLHHMTEKVARQVLLDFIEFSLDQGWGCVRVIHGKGLRSPGLPRLKMMTAQVLRKHPRVIAYTSCRQVDGGTGATDVLLKGGKR